MLHQSAPLKSSLDSFTYDIIKQYILEGKLQPGEQIIQDDLAHKIGVSRTPLRRALLQLSKENLIEMGPRGTFVKVYSVLDEIAVFEIRAVLEGLAARLAATKASQPDVAYMECLFTSVLPKMEIQDSTDYLEADRLFHQKMTEMADSSILADTLGSFQILSVTYRRGLIRTPQETYPEHMAIINAISERDADEAERLSVLHIRNSIRRLRESTSRV